MKQFGKAAYASRPPAGRLSRWGAWAFGLALVVGAGPNVLHAQTAAGTEILNRGSVRFEDRNGGSRGLAEDDALLVVGRYPGIRVEPDRTMYTKGATTLVVPHTVRNTGNSPDTVALDVELPGGWSYDLHVDRNSNGTLERGDPAIPPAGLLLGMAESSRILVVLTIPEPLAVGEARQVTLRGWSTYDTSVADQAVDDILGPPVGLRITKSVSHTQAAPGDTLTYTLELEVYGDGTAEDVVITDQLPGSLDLLAGSIRMDGASVDPGEDPAVEWARRSRTLTATFGSHPAGARRTLEFKVVIPVGTSAETVIENVALLAWTSLAGPDAAESNTVSTRVHVPDMGVEKRVDGPHPATVGDTLRFSLVVRNESDTFWARGVEVTDTVPQPLEVAVADGAEMSGRVLTWPLDPVAPGDSVILVLDAEVSDRAEDGDEVTNRMHAGYPGGPSWSAEADTRVLLSDKDPNLALTIEPGVLEVTLGDMVPYMVTAINDGEVGLMSVNVDVRLPEGTRLADTPIRAYTNGTIGSSVAAEGGGEVAAHESEGLEAMVEVGDGWVEIQPDSVVRSDSGLVVYFPGRVEVGEGYAFSYDMSVMDPPTPTLETQARGQARRGLAYAIGDVMATGLTKVWMRLRQIRPVETRLAIGKVYLDLDGDGRQDADEPGIEGVEIWTEDGSVARSDAEGKYSFVNVRPGRHVFRIDASTVPVWTRVVGPQTRIVEADGWTSPQANFRVAPRVARPTALYFEGQPAADTLLCRGPVECANVVGLIGGDSLPDEVTLDIAPRIGAAGDFVWPVPAGWSVRSVGALDTAGAVVSPERVDDAVGDQWLVWPDAAAGAQRLVLVRGEQLPPDPVVVDPARTAKEREDAESGALLNGPAPEIFEPADGSVLATERLFVGARGEPLHTVELFDGERSLGEHELRPDGVHDYINMSLETEGPHTLRLRMENSWGNERWDSVRVHVGGPPATFESGSPIRLQPGEQTRVRIRARDAWGVPVVRGSHITVEAEGARIRTRDANGSSVGHQISLSEDGWLDFTLEGGAHAGEYTLDLAYGNEVTARFPVLVLPTDRPLQVTAIGQVGVGSAPDAFAAVTAHGSIGDQTAVMLSIDSRRLDAGEDAFGRDVDPLEEGQYPIIGDASERRDPGASRYAVAGRLERGLDYIAFGDLEQSEFAEGLTLSRYRRALPGATARLGTGPLTWRAFGAVTDQALRQIQLRGDGTSGPYLVGSPFIRGTERVMIQVRAQENAARILNERVLRRHEDYQVDADRGYVLLKRPLPAYDLSGNHVFLVVTFESEGTGEARPVWGLQMSGALGDTARVSLPFGLQVVRDAQPGRTFSLAGANGGLRLGAHTRLMGEVAYAASDTASDIAHHIHGVGKFRDGMLTLDGRWMRVGDSFHNPADASVRRGIEEVEAGAAVKLGGTELEVRREQQDFGVYGGERERTQAGIEQELPGNFRVTATAGRDAAQRDSVSSSARFLEERVEWKPHRRVKLWGEARQQGAENNGQLQDGDYLGGGFELGIVKGVALEARHLLVEPDSGGDYSLTSVGLRSELATGTKAWGRYQLEGGIDEARGAAIVGLNQRVALGESWTARGTFERREGVEQAPLASRIRAHPFAGQESDYWAASLGAEYLPADKPYRLTGQVEYRDGDRESSERATLAGDVTLGGGVALLSRQEVQRRERRTSAGEPETSERLWSLWGLAFRPLRTESLNTLLKLEWKREDEPGAASYLGRSGTQRERALAVAEFIWSPASRAEVGVRYGRRFLAQEIISTTTGIPMEQRTDADFVGGRARLGISGSMGIEAEAQGLRNIRTDEILWSVAPGVVMTLAETLEMRVGHRFGPLLDPDFARHRGAGWYVTFGALLTEATGATVADFWRSRLSRP